MNSINVIWLFISCVDIYLFFVDKNTQISWIDMRLQSDRPKIVNLHTSSIIPFWALTGPVAMSLGVSESWDIESIDIVDNKYNFFLDNASMVDCCWQNHHCNPTQQTPLVADGLLRKWPKSINFQILLRIYTGEKFSALRAENGCKTNVRGVYC